MDIKIKFTSSEPLKPILSNYGEFTYTFVFDQDETYSAYYNISDAPPLAFQKANHLIKEIQIKEQLIPTFTITYDELVYESTNTDISSVRSMLLRYIKNNGLDVVFDQIDCKLLPIDMIKYVADDFDMGFVSQWDEDQTADYKFISYNHEHGSIQIDVTNPPPNMENKINLSVYSEDIPFDDLLSISKAIFIKNIL